MFCENCGKQLPDNSAFCDNCGMQMTAVAPAAPAQPAVAKQPFVLTKQHKLFGLIGIGVAALIIIVAIIVGIAGKTVNLENYITITPDGYNGYATIAYELDYYAIFEKVTGQDISHIESMDDLDSLANATSVMAKAELLEGGLNVDVTYPDGKESGRLANGDVVTFTVTFDKDDAEKLDAKFKDATIKYVIEGLADADVYDVLSHFDVSFEGCDGDGHAVLTPTESTETVGGIRFTVHEDDDCVYYYISDTDDDGYLYVEFSGDTYDLSTGDTVTVTVSAESNRLAEYGVILDGLTKECEVAGLGKYASALSEISTDAIDTFSSLYMDDLKNRLYDDWGYVVHGSSWRTYKEQSIGNDLKLYKTILTTSKNTNTVGNSLWLIYSVTLDDSAIDKPTVCYFYYQICNVVINADGTVDTASEYDIYKSSAYTDYNALYDDNIDSFNLNIEVQ